MLHLVKEQEANRFVGLLILYGCIGVWYT